ncbi:hypothetical protein ACEZ3G_05860 [Maribacter algicola]|uniref:Uncharacterized protein n=1 Tax=Meishania litoralis TaxID=3434685 RepID=A0ACC7LID1_9FLAO
MRKVHAQKTVEQLTKEFNQAYTQETGRKLLFAYAKDNYYNSKNGQGHYYMAWSFEGLLQAWQATGDPEFFDDLQQIINSLRSSAKNLKGISKDFRGWPAGDQYYKENGATLFDSYLWRFVFTFYRIIEQSPNLKKENLNWYEDNLNWAIKNIWDRYENQGIQYYIYRENPYMTSHWGRIAMELYLITSEPKYLITFENISYKGISGKAQNGQHILNRFKPNVGKKGALDFSPNWSLEATGTTDGGHFSDVVSFITNAIENKMYWHTQKEWLLPGIISTYRDIVWDDKKNMMGTGYLNGTSDPSGYAQYGRTPISQGAQLNLGRFDENFQKLLEEHYTPNANTFNKVLLAGILLNNRVILENGKPFYPEVYIYSEN